MGPAVYLSIALRIGCFPDRELALSTSSRRDDIIRFSWGRVTASCAVSPSPVLAGPCLAAWVCVGGADGVGVSRGSAGGGAMGVSRLSRWRGSVWSSFRVSCVRFIWGWGVT